MGNATKLAVLCLAAAAMAACATRSPIEAKSAVKSPAPAAKPVTAAEAKPAVPRQTESPPPALPAPVATPAPAAPQPQAREAAASTAQKLAVLRVEAGALVTRVNGDPRLACTNPDCSIPLPPGTHRFTVGYKDAVTRTGSHVTFAAMRSREIEVTLEPGHTYSVSASGKHTPNWWIAVEDETANRIVYNDREGTE